MAVGRAHQAGGGTAGQAKLAPEMPVNSLQAGRDIDPGRCAYPDIQCQACDAARASAEIEPRYMNPTSAPTRATSIASQIFLFNDTGGRASNAPSAAHDRSEPSRKTDRRQEETHTTLPSGCLRLSPCCGTSWWGPRRAHGPAGSFREHRRPIRRVYPVPGPRPSGGMAGWNDKCRRSRGPLCRKDECADLPRTRSGRHHPRRASGCIRNSRLRESRQLPGEEDSLAGVWLTVRAVAIPSDVRSAAVLARPPVLRRGRQSAMPALEWGWGVAAEFCGAKIVYRFHAEFGARQCPDPLPSRRARVGRIRVPVRCRETPDSQCLPKSAFLHGTLCEHIAASSNRRQPCSSSIPPRSWRSQRLSPPSRRWSGR